MEDLRQNIRGNIEELEREIQSIEEILRGAPEGCMKYQKKNHSTYFYHQCYDENTGNVQRKYIKKKDAGLAYVLAQKGYLTKLLPILKEEANQLKSFEGHYHPEKKQEVFATLGEVRKTMVSPLYQSVDDIIRKWNEEDIPIYDAHPENLRFETDRGEMVRSKSELILANFFHKYKNKLSYKYERPLELMDHGEPKVIHPDFTLLNLETGKLVYWEHAGRMDDARYAEGFLRKINLYIFNDIVPGENLVITYESYASPLDMGIVKLLLRQVMA